MTYLLVLIIALMYALGGCSEEQAILLTICVCAIGLF